MQECCSKKMMRGEAQGKQTMHPHRLDMARLAASVFCKGSPPTSVSNNRPGVLMPTSLSSMEKVWQVEPQGRRDGQGILQLPQGMTFILIANLGRR